MLCGLDKPFYIVVYAVYFVHKHFYVLSAVNFCIYDLHNLILLLKAVIMLYFIEFYFLLFYLIFIRGE